MSSAITTPKGGGEFLQRFGSSGVAIAMVVLLTATIGLTIGFANQSEGLKPIASDPRYQMYMSSLLVSYMIVGIEHFQLQRKMLRAPIEGDILPVLTMSGVREVLGKGLIMSLPIFGVMYATAEFSAWAGINGGICPNGTAANDKLA